MTIRTACLLISELNIVSSQLSSLLSVEELIKSEDVVQSLLKMCIYGVVLLSSPSNLTTIKYTGLIRKITKLHSHTLCLQGCR